MAQLQVQQQKIGFTDILALSLVGAEREAMTILKERGTLNFVLGGTFGVKDMATIGETAAGFLINHMAKNRDGNMARAGLDVFAAGYSNLVPLLADMARGFISGTARTPQSLRGSRVIQRPAIGTQSARPVIQNPTPYAQRVTSSYGIAQNTSYPKFT